jgi:oligosaccharide repeat unit polymerase
VLFIFIFFYYVIVYISLLKIKSNLIISPSFWLLISWGFIFGLYYTSGIKYKFSLNYLTSAYIFLILILFLIFYFFGINLKINKNRIDTINYRKKIWTLLYFILSIFGIILWIFDVLRLNNINFGYRINNFSISIIGTLGMLFLNLALIVWLYELAYSINFNKRIPLKAYISVIIYLVPAFVTSGRQPILIIVISTFIILVYSLKKNQNYKFKKTIKKFILFGILSFFFYAIMISTKRAGVSNKAALFEEIFKSKTPVYLLDFTNCLEGLGEVILEAIYYYSHQLSMFEIFYNNYNGTKFWGLAQFHYIGRRFPDVYYQAQTYIDITFSKVGVYSHVWMTAIASFIIDYGRFGTTIFVSILGFIIGRKRRKFNYIKTTYELVFLTLICTGIAFSIQFSPFSELSWAYPLYWLIVIPVFEIIFKYKN